MKRNVLLIANPVAGNARSGLLAGVGQRLRDLGLSVTEAETAGPNSAERVAGDNTADIILIAGGDGTIRDVIDRLGQTNAALAILPLGTANVLATEIGLSARAEDIVDTTLNGEALPLYLGKVGDRHFTVMASVGFDADVVAHVNVGIKKYIGRAAYGLSALRRLWSFNARQFTITANGTSYQCGGVIFCNGKHYGGRYLCAPDACVHDSGLHACLMQASRRVDMLRYAFALARGSLATCKGVQVIYGTDFVVEGPNEGQPAPIQADGDIVGQTPATISSDTQSHVTLQVPRSH